MARKSNSDTPTVISGILYTNDVNTTGISLSEFAWSAWLEDALTFYFQTPDGSGSFTARKERQRNDYYWYGYKRIAGKLHKRYIGAREDVTAERLAELAQKFTALIK